MIKKIFPEIKYFIAVLFLGMIALNLHAEEYSERKLSHESQLYVQSFMSVINNFGRNKSFFGKENSNKKLNMHIESIATENDAIYIDLWPFLSDSKVN